MIERPTLMQPALTDNNRSQRTCYASGADALLFNRRYKVLRLIPKRLAASDIFPRLTEIVRAIAAAESS